MSEQTATQQTILNGVNVTQLGDTVELMKSNAELAQFKFRASNKWIGGGHSRTTIKEFYGACQEDTLRKKAHVIDIDEPEMLLGGDNGANPAEALLHALAGCITVTIAYKAAAHGIKIHEIESEIEGDIDLRGLLEISDDVRNGFENIRVNFKIKADGPEENLELFKDLAKGSPVFDMLTNPVPVTVNVESK